MNLRSVRSMTDRADHGIRGPALPTALLASAAGLLALAVLAPLPANAVANETLTVSSAPNSSLDGTLPSCSFAPTDTAANVNTATANACLSAGGLTLASSGDVVLADTISGPGTLTISADGSVLQTAGGVGATGLSVFGSSISLTGATNNVSTLVMSTSGIATYVGSSAVTLASVFASTLSVTAPTITQSAAITVPGTATLTATAGDITLTNAGNSFETLNLFANGAAQLAGSIDTIDAAGTGDALTVNDTRGLALTGGVDAGTVTVVAAGGVALLDAVITSSGNVTIVAYSPTNPGAPGAGVLTFAANPDVTTSGTAAFYSATQHGNQFGSGVSVNHTLVNLGPEYVESATEKYGVTYPSGTPTRPYTLFYSDTPPVPSVSLTASPAASLGSTYGQQVTLTTTVSVAQGSTPTGTVTVTADGTAIPGCGSLPLDDNAQASCVTTALARADNHQLVATYAGGQYHSAHSPAASYSVAKATPTVALSANPSGSSTSGSEVTLTATVTRGSSAAASTAAPSGEVAFSDGGSVISGCEHVALAVVNGAPTATCTTSTLTVATHTLGARYAGDGNYLTANAPTVQQVVSKASTPPPPVVTNPTISAKVTSAHARTRYGWYRGAVTITFRCHAGSAPIQCPSPVTLAASGRNRSVTRTVTATDGGHTSITVSHLNIDRHQPRLRVTGVRNGASYRSFRHLRCHATDALSGVASCRISQHRHHHRHTNRTSVRYVVTATDRAGNQTTVTGHYTVRRR